MTHFTRTEAAIISVLNTLDEPLPGNVILARATGAQLALTSCYTHLSTLRRKGVPLVNHFRRGYTLAHPVELPPPPPAPTEQAKRGRPALGPYLSTRQALLVNELRRSPGFPVHWTLLAAAMGVDTGERGRHLVSTNVQGIRQKFGRDSILSAPRGTKAGYYLPKAWEKR